MKGCLVFLIVAGLFICLGPVGLGIALVVGLIFILAGKK
jgi:hypothetical protein